MKVRVLVVDDDSQSRESTRRILESSGFEVSTAEDGQAALEAARSATPPQVIVTDLRMPRLDGMDFLRALHLRGERTPVILMTAFGRVEDAVDAMKLGAVDFLSKPFRRQALLDSIGAAMKRAELGKPLARAGGEAQSAAWIGESRALRELNEQIGPVARSGAPVLITGESGSGKERVARMLHEQSLRAAGPWVAINCAALPEALLESELFGHEKGAFSGAVQAKRGLFEAAHGGTLFLDEIGDMPLNLQAKLLRVLQEGEVRRVGATQTQKFDARVIAATHQPLEERVAQGSFRQDLLFRLEVIRLRVPPLRERGEDIPALANAFLQSSAARMEKPVSGFSEEALDVLLRHTWPGNVRELANAVERAVVFAQEERVEVRDLPEHIVALAERAPRPMPGRILEVKIGTPLREVEDLLIRRTLEATEGDKSMTARLLGINERTIYRRLKDAPSGE
jgi:two-component system response regulator HydG